jgi:hypothetical protein
MERDPTAGNVLLTAVVCSGAAAAIHMFVMPEHFEEWIGYGLFFAVAAAAQAVFAVALVTRRTTPALLWAGIAGNLLIITVWVISRTVGVPWFGPEAGEVEEVGRLDLTSKVFEVVLIACLVQLMRTRDVASARQTVGSGGAGRKP